MPTAERYPRAGNPGDLLPQVYGDFLHEGATTSDIAAGGATPAVLIDVDNWVYCVNAHPSGPTNPLVYVEDVLQDPGVFIYQAFNDYAATNNFIATIQFAVNPAGRRISVRMQGTTDADVVITNPIAALQHFFTQVGTWALGDFDRSSVYEAKRTADALGYEIHWYFGQNRTYKEWLTDILLSYMADHYLTLAGTLGIAIPTDTPPQSEAILAELDVRQHVDLLGTGDPDNAVVYELDARNLIHTAILRYQYKWHTNEYAQERTFTDRAAIARYGEKTVAKKEFSLPGIRTTAHAERWARTLFSRYAIDPATVAFAIRSLRYLHLTPPNLVTLTWAAAPSQDATGWRRRILKILNTVYQWKPVPHVELECFDLKYEMKEGTYLVLLDQLNNPWYLYANNESTLTLDNVGHPQERLNPTPYHWIRRTAPDSTLVYFYPAPWGELLGSTVQPPVGAGTADAVALVDRSYHTWDIVAVTHAFVEGRARRMD